MFFSESDMFSRFAKKEIVSDGKLLNSLSISAFENLFRNEFLSDSICVLWPPPPLLHK